jgi:RNase adaptor protein for sRNA GlmZ degradation
MTTQDQHILFVIGASGVGKTTAVETLAARSLPDVACFHFDSIGVPTLEEMSRAFGSPERWQEAITREWIARLKGRSEHLLILEGQTRPSFILDGLGEAREAAGIVLLDCTPSARSHRLRSERQQPELDTSRMNEWAAYLRGQADALHLPVIDTTPLTANHVADELHERALTVPLWATLNER